MLKSLFGIFLLAGALFAQGSACEKLAGLKLPDTTITMAQSVAAGALTSPPMPNGRATNPAMFRSLPAFCRVAATLAPAKDSDIKIEVWMPASGWNGKFQAVGNGGWSGAINPGALAAALHRGYAAAGTDTGHSGGRAEFALGHPEKLIDFSYRSEHEMVVKAKAIIAAYYGNGPKYSYWNGCSSGGRQGLTEAQRYPNDFDGIIAGAPAIYWTHLMFGDQWPAHADMIDPATHIPESKYPLIHRAALDACDALDGVKDGVIEDPTRCHFDPKVLECKGADAPTCLTAPQVEAARKIYGGARNPRTGQQIFPGMEPGSEMVWRALAGGPQVFQIPVDHFKYVVFKNPDWDWKTLNFDQDVALADKTDHGLLNSINPDLKAFFAHGGKLIQYHGWNDQLIAPLNSVNYYKSVEENLGNVSANYRLFMVPGMGHCGGGDGASNFDMVSVIEQWVEQNKAPERIVAERRADGAIERTHPLCPYPETAHYKGSGSTDDAANFVCK